jgi:hypothetical protein
VPTRPWQQYLSILKAKYGIARSNADTTSPVENKEPSKPSAKKYKVVIESSSDEGDVNERVSVAPSSRTDTVSLLPCLEQFTTSC